MSKLNEEKELVKSLFGEKEYLITKEEDYLIDINYGQKDWTMVSAIREILANMLDTKTAYSYGYENGVATIEDNGTGLPRKAFVMGASSKSDDNTSIGQFGEGLKMALVTSLRNEKRISIQTVEYGVEVVSSYSDEYETQLMKLYYTDNAREIGTSIKIECDIEDWNQALDLFLQFKEGFQKLDNNLFLPNGYISILGLKTEEKSNMLFSYDLNDKTITNRDRNAVKSKKLRENMEKILNNIKNQKAVRMYLCGLDDAPDSEEYKIVLDPKNKEIWVTTISKVYGEKVVYSTTVENDIKATAIGYKVIKSLTKASKSSFANLGILSSKEVTKEIKNQDVGLVEKDKIIYAMSKNYVESWTYLEAGRELLANALDSSTDSEIATIEFKDGYCIIRDNGKGILKQNFVIGNSKKESTDIGMFGEGLKLAALVMAREDRDMSIETVGTTYTPIIEESDTFGTEIFALKTKINHRTKGTVIRFTATEKEVSNIRDLFISYKKNIKMFSSERIDVVLNEQGNIYVNGLNASKVNSLFSYNIKDKTLVNTRDRNNVDDTKLSNELSSFYDNLENEDIIKEFLTYWKTDRNLYEYKLVIVPSKRNIWEKVINENFKNSCIASTYDMESNFIAKQAGFELLVESPSYVKEILSQFVKSSTDIAIEYKEKGILFGNRILYPITDDYAVHWNRTDAISELLANAIDTETEVTPSYCNGMITIEDLGKGFEKKNLLFGKSNNREIGQAIGTFGEGLKMACLVLSKSKQNVTIATVGFTAIASLQEDKEFNATVLVLKLSENERKVGTKITFSGTEEELTAAKSKFLSLTDEYKKVGEEEFILLPGGKVFVNGMEITSINSIYSYNLTGYKAKNSLNRDRKTLNNEISTNYIISLIGETSNEDIMKSILLNRNYSKVEANIGNRSYEIVGKWKRRWKKVAQEVFANSCLPHDNSELNLVAKDKGFKVLLDLLDSTKALLSFVNFPKSNEVIKVRGDEDIVRKVIEEKDLAETELKKWSIIKDVVDKAMGDKMSSKLNICEEFINPTDGETLGLYSPANNQCYILRKLLSNSNYSLAVVLGVVRHEYAHMESGAHDRTREFENALSDIIGDLLVKLYVK